MQNHNVQYDFNKKKKDRYYGPRRARNMRERKEEQTSSKKIENIFKNKINILVIDRADLSN